MLRWSAFVCVLWLAGLAGNSEAVSIPAPHVNLTPTVGVARWDTNVLVNGSGVRPGLGVLW